MGGGGTIFDLKLGGGVLEETMISWMNQIQTFLLSFLMNVPSHFPNFIFLSEVLLRVAFSKLRFSQAIQGFLFLK